MDVDAVHQRAADLRAVTDDHLRRAAALALRVTVVAAGTWLRCHFTIGEIDLENSSFRYVSQVTEDSR